jgi:ABC-type sugar transport system ATPase subunit
VLAAEKLTTAKLRDVSFELRRGEVLGIAGLVGSGRSELGAALFGIDRITGGTLAPAGRAARPARRATPWRAASGCCPKTAACKGS